MSPHSDFPHGPNTSRTLEQLEGFPWSAPGDGSTPMVERCHALRKIPIGRLSSADLRLLLGQDIGARFLMPLALEVLETDPLTEAEYYPGDLLKAAMNIPAGYWTSHTVERQRLLSFAQSAGRTLAEAEEPLASSRQLLREIASFTGTRDT
jgi:hypothetical protein